MIYDGLLLMENQHRNRSRMPFKNILLAIVKQQRGEKSFWSLIF